MPKSTRKHRPIPPLTGAVVDEFLKAEIRVRGKPYSRQNVMRWLLDFSFRNSARFSQTDWHDVQWEALIFAYDADKGSHSMSSVPLPTKQELMEIQQWLLDLWPSLKSGNFAPIQTRPPAQMLRWMDGKIHGIVLPLSVPWSEAFKAHTYEISTAGEVAERFRFCLECSRPYCARKRQAYCSSSCSQKHRTRQWRQKNRAQFRAARRAAYKRKVEESLGSPVKITTRSK